MRPLNSVKIQLEQAGAFVYETYLHSLFEQGEHALVVHIPVSEVADPFMVLIAEHYASSLLDKEGCLQWQKLESLYASKTGDTEHHLKIGGRDA